jgi:hypothetical protein
MAAVGGSNIAVAWTVFVSTAVDALLTLTAQKNRCLDDMLQTNPVVFSPQENFTD